MAEKGSFDEQNLVNLIILDGSIQIPEKEFLRVRHNAWRAHKRKLLKSNYRIARVRTTETEL